RLALVLAFSLATIPAFCQRPSDPALLVPQKAPELDYAPVADPLAVPPGATMGASAGVAFDSKGHLYVLYRGAKPIVEFDAEGKFIRSVGEGLFTRAHGIRIDPDGNIWVTDVGAHTVVKL